MALNVAEFEQKPDFPKMGPSLLIGACLILALRTAKWSIRKAGKTASDKDLESELEHAIQLAGRMMSVLIPRYASLFPHKSEAWFIWDEEDQPN